MPTVQTNDIETYYERRGNGPPVVFIHGAIVDYTQWEPQLDALSDEYTTIAYDVRGHGRTGGSDRETYSIDLFADDLAALVDALELDRPVICGLSLGGCIAQVYADRYPDRLSGLVLADTFGPKPLSPGERVQRRLLRATIPLVRLFGYERVERMMVGLQEQFSKGVSGEYENIEAIRETGPTMATTEFAKVIRALARFHETPVGYRSISVPTLVLYGEHDAEFIRQHAPVLADNIRGAEVREVPGAGHASNLDNPEFVTDALRLFLRNLWSGNGLSVRDTTVAGPA
jgi:pimeloyl-ACP methyl ester carboxylesterase